MTNIYDVAFSYSAGINPVNGASIFRDVTDQEIRIHYGKSFSAMDQEEQQLIIEQYNLNQ